MKINSNYFNYYINSCLYSGQADLRTKAAAIVFAIAAIAAACFFCFRSLTQKILSHKPAKELSHRQTGARPEPARALSCLPSEKNPLLTLNTCVYIFSYLDLPDLMNCHRIGKSFSNAAQSDILWKSIASRANFPLIKKEKAKTQVVAKIAFDFGFYNPNTCCFIAKKGKVIDCWEVVSRIPQSYMVLPYGNRNGISKGHNCVYFNPDGREAQKIIWEGEAMLPKNHPLKNIFLEGLLDKFFKGEVAPTSTQDL